MEKYQERKSKLPIYILTIIIIIALILFIISVYSYFKKSKLNESLSKYYGTYEIRTNNFKSYGEDITGSKILEINKDNLKSKGLITSQKINYIEFDDIDAVLIYFNDIASTNSNDEDRISELGFMKFCFTKENNSLKQIDCPNIVNDQNLGESIKNVFIEYEKKTK